ncbi:MAG TPA: hypothetical protein VMU84_20710 [Thermoanaerobaculia bacterium]|nr:hypothetical protein [Thermoanaerobaculia bacterium]
MSKRNSLEEGDPLDHEIDFSKLERVPNTYARDYGRNRNIRILDPALLEIFPDSQSVNEALRTLVRVASAQAAQPKQKLSARRATAPKSKKRKAS